MLPAAASTDGLERRNETSNPGKSGILGYEVDNAQDGLDWIVRIGDLDITTGFSFVNMGLLSL